MDSITTRIKSGQNANDQPSKPLKGAHGNYEPYAVMKQKKGLQGLRDWAFSGRLLRSMKVLSVSQEGGTIGFTDARSNRVANYLNKIERSFSVSPNDQQKMEKKVQSIINSVPIVVPTIN